MCRRRSELWLSTETRRLSMAFMCLSSRATRSSRTSLISLNRRSIDGSCCVTWSLSAEAEVPAAAAPGMLGGAVKDTPERVQSRGKDAMKSRINHVRRSEARGQGEGEQRERIGVRNEVQKRKGKEGCMCARGIRVAGCGESPEWLAGVYCWDARSRRAPAWHARLARALGTRAWHTLTVGGDLLGVGDEVACLSVHVRGAEVDRDVHQKEEVDDEIEDRPADVPLLNESQAEGQGERDEEDEDRGHRVPSQPERRLRDA